MIASCSSPSASWRPFLQSSSSLSIFSISPYSFCVAFSLSCRDALWERIDSTTLACFPKLRFNFWRPSNIGAACSRIFSSASEADLNSASASAKASFAFCCAASRPLTFASASLKAVALAVLVPSACTSCSAAALNSAALSFTSMSAAMTSEDPMFWTTSSRCSFAFDRAASTLRLSASLRAKVRFASSRACLACLAAAEARDALSVALLRAAFFSDRTFASCSKTFVWPSIL
mmetsp:Transcript_6981/g.18840  ORF Transcript_6981/g.18840 Transcript_6981/m.18840 type:complete len:233 (+) Transcript_6981:654-1352(+)